VNVGGVYSIAEDEVVVKNPLAALTERKEEEKQAYQNLLRGWCVWII